MVVKSKGNKFAEVTGTDRDGVFKFLNRLNGNYEIGFHFKSEKFELDFGIKKLNKFYRKMCKALYDDGIKNPNKFEMVLFPEYNTDNWYSDEMPHLYYHGVLKINPGEYPKFNSLCDEIWLGLGESTLKTWLEELRENDSTETPYEWNRYIMKEYHEHKIYYQFRNL